jgi:hypothetical protein
MHIAQRAVLAFGSVVAVGVLFGCSVDTITPSGRHVAGVSRSAIAVSSASVLPSGERVLGQNSIEPAYNDVTGTLTYLLTPGHGPFPTHTSTNAVAPLYLVEYPPGSTVGTLNCMGVPGNCPDHDAEVAGAATSIMPSVYGTDPTLVPGHDHLVATPASGGDFNVAWEVIEVLFTNKAAGNTHLTTESAIDAAVARGDAIEVDLGFAFHCSVVSATAYERGTPR